MWCITKTLIFLQKFGPLPGGLLFIYIYYFLIKNEHFIKNRIVFASKPQFFFEISDFGNLKTVWFWGFQVVQNISICIQMLLSNSRNVYIASSCIDLCKWRSYCDAMNILILLLLFCFDCLLLPGIGICIMNNWQHIWKPIRYKFSTFCPDKKIASGKKTWHFVCPWLIVCMMCNLLQTLNQWHTNTHQYTHTVHMSVHISVHIWVHTSVHRSVHT